MRCFLLVTLIACGPTAQHATSASPRQAAPTFAAEDAVDRWIATLRAESPDCSISVRVLTTDSAQLSFDDPHAKHDPKEPPKQIVAAQYVWVEPFVSEADVASRRDANQKRFDACMADAGSGPHLKGRDMNAESCALSVGDGPPIPSAHLDRDLSVAFPNYFFPPAACEQATTTLEARLASYP